VNVEGFSSILGSPVEEFAELSLVAIEEMLARMPFVVGMLAREAVDLR